MLQILKLLREKQLKNCKYLIANNYLIWINLIDICLNPGKHLILTCGRLESSLVNFYTVIFIHKKLVCLTAKTRAAALHMQSVQCGLYVCLFRSTGSHINRTISPGSQRFGAVTKPNTFSEEKNGLQTSTLPHLHIWISLCSPSEDGATATVQPDNF